MIKNIDLRLEIDAPFCCYTSGDFWIFIFAGSIPQAHEQAQRISHTYPSATIMIGHMLVDQIRVHPFDPTDQLKEP